MSVSELATLNAQKKTFIPTRLAQKLSTIRTRERNYCALGFLEVAEARRPIRSLLDSLRAENRLRYVLQL